MNVLLSKKSALGQIEVPIDLAVKVGREYFLKEECGNHFQTGKPVPLGSDFKLLEGNAYPIRECFMVRIERGNQREMHISMCPDLIRALDGSCFLNQTVAINCGYRDVDGAWQVVHDNDGYHSGGRADFSKADSLFRIGFEIEKEDKAMKEKYPAVLLRKIGWAKERDGSLSEETGYELVSPVYDMFEDKLEQDILKHEMLQNLINGKFSNRCGGHINVSCTSCGVKSLYKKFIPWYPLLYAMYPRRIQTATCLARKSDEMIASGKYSAIFCKEYALEFRIFPAVANVRDLMWRLRLMRYLVNTNIRDFETIPEMLKSNQEFKTLISEGGFAPETLAKSYPDYVKSYA